METEAKNVLPQGSTKRVFPQEPPKKVLCEDKLETLLSKDPFSEKILVAGDVAGNFTSLFSRARKIESVHGKFSFILVVGDFFGDDPENWKPYSDGVKKVSIETYILGPASPKQMRFYPRLKAPTAMVNLTNNVYYLGKLGIFTTKTGFNIGFLSGREATESSPWGYTEEEVNELIVMICDKTKRYLPLDIFVTPQWPSNISPDCKTQYSSDQLQLVLKTLCPRYVFSTAEGLWFKRSPYTNEHPFENVWTRFIGLGKFNTVQKSLYALDLTKEIKQIRFTKPKQSPFIDVVPTLSVPQHRWDTGCFSEEVVMNVEEEEETDLEPKRRRQSRVNRDTCWFCLSSSDLEDYYILNLGEHSYVARSKGGIVSDHLLITSVNHVKCYVKLSENAKEEIAKNKRSIKRYFMEKGSLPLFFERNIDSTVHFHMDAVPIPPNKSAMLKTVFEEYAEKFGLEIEWHSRNKEFLFPFEHRFQYFYAELPSSDVLFIRIADSFPPNFARLVLADKRILNQPGHINWQKAVRPVDVETDITKQVRTAFNECTDLD